METLSPFSILMVDDDATVIRVLKRILGEFSPLRFATNAHTALQLARRSTPDLILLGVEMPELNGFDVCRALKSDASLREVPIIFLTGHEDPQIESEGLELGAFDFIRKPPNAALVLTRVRSVQRLKMLSDQLRSTVALDYLTGAVKRRHIEKSLTAECSRAEHTDSPLAWLLIDMDDFVAYNADGGEVIGDDCLRQVADSLRAVACRPNDTLGRWSGGQFALLLPDTGLTEANTVALRAIDAVDGLRIRHPGKPKCHVTVTIGGLVSSRIRSAPTVLNAAERALTEARALGGSRACILANVASGF